MRFSFTAMTYFHPETLKRIARLDLRARHVVDGFLSGLHKSRHFGNSVEFRQHRQYVPGDDPRNVDWKVWAKQDKLHVKQYEIDTNLRLTLLLDTSKSMRYGSNSSRSGMTKYDYGCTLAASLAYLAIRQQDAVGCILFDSKTKTALPAKMKQSQLSAIHHLMENGKGQINNKNVPGSVGPDGVFPDFEVFLNDIKNAQPNMQDAMKAAAESIRPNGLVVIVSDFLVQRAGLFHGLRYLRSHGHDVLVLHVLDDMELDFTLSGATRFEGLELPVQIRCDPRMLRDGYLSALREYLDEMKEGCIKMSCDYGLFRTSTPLDAALAAYLSKRNSRV